MRQRKVIGVARRCVWYNRDVIRCGLCGDFEKLSHATNPGNIWLEDINRVSFDELSESVSRVFVLNLAYKQYIMWKNMWHYLSSSPFELWHSSLDADVPVDVVSMQNLFPPIDVQVKALGGKLDRVLNVETHVAVNLENKLEDVP